MDYLPHTDQVIYLRGIRRRMDYRTGIAGVSASISYDWLSQLCEVHPRRGSHIKEPARLTKEALRAVFARLEVAGLVEHVRDHGGRGLVFRCLLADLDDSVQMRSNPRTTPEQPHTNNPTTFSNGAAFVDMNNPRTTHAAPAKSNPIQVTGIQDKPIPDRESGLARKPKDSRGARLTLTELPADWREWARQERPDLDPIRTWDLFSDYWRAKPGKDGVKTDWLATWRNWVRRENSNKGGRVNGKTSVSDHNRSALDAWLNGDAVTVSDDIIEGECIRESIR